MSFDERIRLLYVACTRARDHLVVSLHRKAHAKAPSATRRTNAELLLDGMGSLVDELPDGAEAVNALPLSFLAPPAPLLPLEQWAASAVRSRACLASDGVAATA